MLAGVFMKRKLLVVPLLLLFLIPVITIKPSNVKAQRHFSTLQLLQFKAGSSEAAAEQGFRVVMDALEYHMCRVPPETSYVGSEPRDLHYHLHFQLQNREEGFTLYSSELNITDITDMPINPETGELEPGCQLSPQPTSFGSNWIYWYIGDLEGSERFEDWYHVHWDDEERETWESLGFSARRDFDLDEIPLGEDSVVQTVTVEVNPEERDKVLYAGIEYGQQLVSVELLECSPGANFVTNGVEWRVEPPLQDHYVFYAKFRVTRKPGVMGSIKVIPGARADLRTWDTYSLHNTNSVREQVEVGIVNVKTQTVVDWDIVHERSRTVFFQWLERSSLPQGRFLTLQFYQYIVEPSSKVTVDAEPKTLVYHLYTSILSMIGTLPGVKLEANIVQQPETYNVGELAEGEEFSKYWDYKDKTIQESLGFSVTRRVEPAVIPEGQESITQTVEVTVDLLGDGSWLRSVDCRYKQELVETELISYTPMENVPWALNNYVQWWFQPSGPNTGTYTFKAVFKVKRKPGVTGAILVIPEGEASVSRVWKEDWVKGSSVEQEVEVGEITVTTTNPVNWLTWHDEGKRALFLGVEQEFKALYMENPLERANEILDEEENYVNTLTIPADLKREILSKINGVREDKGDILKELIGKAEEAIKEAEKMVEDAEGHGLDISEAEKLLSLSKEEFESGRYELALRDALNSRQGAIDALKSVVEKMKAKSSQEIWGHFVEKTREKVNRVLEKLDRFNKFIDKHVSLGDISAETAEKVKDYNSQLSYQFALTRSRLTEKYQFLPYSLWYADHLGETTVLAGYGVEFRFGWAALEHGQIEDFLGNHELKVSVDGVEVTGSWEIRQVYNPPYGWMWVAVWYYYSPPLDVGLHSSYIYLEITGCISDGITDFEPGEHWDRGINFVVVQR